tara:strand:- start:556 stop:720 length:165 start_codon:yes stop_codon:yes gene_type:complete
MTIQEQYDKIRQDLSEKTDAFGSMTLDGVHITASNLLVAYYLEKILKEIAHGKN